MREFERVSRAIIHGALKSKELLDPLKKLLKEEPWL
jgi:hypothetical protein